MRAAVAAPAARSAASINSTWAAPGNTGGAVAQSMLVDHPVVGGELSEAFDRAVTAHAARMQDRMLERDVARTEVLAAQRVERHARLGPHAEVDGHDVEVAALARERVDQRVGRGVGGLSGGRERGRGRSDQHQQRHAAARQCVDERRGTARLRADDGLDVGAIGRAARSGRSSSRPAVWITPSRRPCRSNTSCTMSATGVGVGDVAGDDFDRRRDRLERGEPAQSPRARVARRVRCRGSARARSRGGTGSLRHDDEVGVVRLGEPAGEREAHASEAAGDEIGAAGDDRRRCRSDRVGVRCQIGVASPVAAARHDAGARHRGLRRRSPRRCDRSRCGSSRIRRRRRPTSRCSGTPWASTPARPNASASAGFDGGIPADVGGVARDEDHAAVVDAFARALARSGTSECNHRSMPAIDRRPTASASVLRRGARARPTARWSVLGASTTRARSPASVNARAIACARSSSRRRRSPTVRGIARRAGAAAGCRSTTAATSSRSSTRCASSREPRFAGLRRSSSCV